MPTIADFSHVKDDRLRRLVAHWLDIRADRILPGRRQIDPAAIAAVLPYVWLCDYEPAGRRFRYRLAGERIADVFGRSLRGLWLDEFFPPERLPQVLARYRAVVERGVIVHNAGGVYMENGRLHPRGERIILPLGDDGVPGDALIGATICDWVNLDRAAPASGQSETQTPVRADPPA